MLHFHMFDYVVKNCSEQQQQQLLPFNSPLSGTIQVSRHQKGRTILDFKEARDDRVALASAGPYGNHFHLDPDR